MYRLKTTPACVPSSCASDRFRRVTRVSFPILRGKRVRCWRKRVGEEEEEEEEERVIQRCAKIVRFPGRKTYVCVGVTLDRYGYRLFTAVAWPDKSTERCRSPSFLYRLHATLPGPAFNHVCTLLILTRSFPPPRWPSLLPPPPSFYTVPRLVRELDSSRLVTRAASVCIVPWCIASEKRYHRLQLYAVLLPCRDALAFNLLPPSLRGKANSLIGDEIHRIQLRALVLLSFFPLLSLPPSLSLPLSFSSEILFDAKTERSKYCTISLIDLSFHFSALHGMFPAKYRKKRKKIFA